jgi:hypothetical protein
MARFYFHATDGRELVRDAQGDEIARPDELLSRAQREGLWRRGARSPIGGPGRSWSWTSAAA